MAASGSTQRDHMAFGALPNMAPPSRCCELPSTTTTCMPVPHLLSGLPVVTTLKRRDFPIDADRTTPAAFAQRGRNQVVGHVDLGLVHPAHYSGSTDPCGSRSAMTGRRTSHDRPEIQDSERGPRGGPGSALRIPRATCSPCGSAHHPLHPGRIRSGDGELPPGDRLTSFTVDSDRPVRSAAGRPVGVPFHRPRRHGP